MKKASEYRQKKLKTLGKEIVKSRWIYLMILPSALWFFLFIYRPMYWLGVSFYDFSLYKGFEGSEFVGFDNFIKLFTRRNFLNMLWNTLSLNLYSLVLAFPAPIIFALMLNEMRFTFGKKIVQTISFLPHFLSTVAIVGIVLEVLDPQLGLFARIFQLFGRESIYFMGEAKYFRMIMTLSDIWAATGWGAIVYLSALTAVDVNLYEAAMVDGANRWKRMWHITLPGISPTIITMLILRIGNMLSMGPDKILLMQNSINLDQSEVIATYVYKQGLVKMDYSLGTTAGVFNGIVSMILVFVANRISKRFNESAGII